MFRINKLFLAVVIVIVYYIVINLAISDTTVLSFLHIKKDVSSGPIIIPLAIFLNVLPLGAFFYFMNRAVKKYQLHRKKLMENGRKGEASVLTVEDTGMTVNQNPYIKMRLKVTPSFGSEFEVTVKQLVSRLAIPRIGDKVQVVFDPQNVNDLIINL